MGCGGALVLVRTAQGVIGSACGNGTIQTDTLLHDPRLFVLRRAGVVDWDGARHTGVSPDCVPCSLAWNTAPCMSGEARWVSRVLASVALLALIRFDSIR